LRYRKKPVVIEAVQFTGSNLFECLRFMGEPEHVVNNPELHATDAPIVRTLEGDMHTSPGDWIIRGVKGEFYPCKPDIFAATYEAVDGPKHYPPGMQAESQRLHREYSALVEAQRNGARNGREVVALTDEANRKGIVLVPGGENL
jgi:hypothetical protein